MMSKLSAARASESYRVFRIGGHPALAAPDVGKRLRLAGVARYHAFSVKRSGFRFAIELATTLGLDGFFCERSSDPVRSVDGFCFHEWLAEARAALGRGRESVATIVWPPQPDRRRVYVHLMDQDGVTCCFAKIALAPSENHHILNEVSALDWVSPRLMPPAYAPRVLAAGSFRGLAYALVEPLPEKIRPFRAPFDLLRPTMAALTGVPTPVTASDLLEVPWWRNFRATAGQLARGFIDELDARMARPVALCRVHGDFTPANMCSSGGRIWLLDWESSSACGPVLTDEVSYYLSYERGRFLSDPISATARLVDHLVGSSPGRRLDVMLALAFLHVTGRRPASLAIANWSSQEASQVRAAGTPRKTF